MGFGGLRRASWAEKSCSLRIVSCRISRRTSHHDADIQRELRATRYNQTAKMPAVPRPQVTDYTLLALPSNITKEGTQDSLPFSHQVLLCQVHGLEFNAGTGPGTASLVHAATATESGPCELLSLQGCHRTSAHKVLEAWKLKPTNFKAHPDTSCNLSARLRRCDEHLVLSVT